MATVRERRLRRFRGAVLLAVVVALAGWSAAPAQPGNQRALEDPQAQRLRIAGSFDFGAFCLSNIPRGSIVDVGDPDFKPDGVWRQVTLRVDEASARKPRIFFLGGIRRESGLFSQCGADLSAGARRILEGDVLKGTVRFRILEPVAGFTQAFEIDHEGLLVEIGRVRADFPPLYGGNVSPEGVRLLVSNVGRFSANPRKPEASEDDILAGQLRIGTSKLKLQNAKLKLPGATSELRTTLAAGSEGVALNVDIPSGRLSLYKGSFRVANVDLPQGPITIGGAEFDLSLGRAATLDLVGQAGEGGPLMRFQTLTLTARGITHAGPPAAGLTPTEPITIGEIKGPLAPDEGAAQMTNTQAAQIRIPAATVALGGTADRPALAGQGSMVLSRLDAVSLAGEARLAAPNLHAASDLLSKLSAREINLRFSGEKAAPKIEGQLDMSGVRLQTLDLASLDRVPVQFDGKANDGELGLRFSVDTSTPAGRWSFADPTGAIVMLEGAVRQLAAAGTLWFGSAARPPRLQVDPGTFRLAASGTAVRHSLAFGAAADETSLSADVDLRSASGFIISRAATEGRVELATDLLVVNEPALSFNEPGKGQFRILAPLRFDAGVLLGIQLANAEASLIRGHAAIDQFGAEGLTADPIEIADLQVTSPKLTMERLEIDVQNETGTVKGRGLVFEAQSLKHTADPQWEVAALNPRLPEIEATLGRSKDALVLEKGSVRGLDIRADRGSYRSKDGFAVSGEGVVITATHLSESRIDAGRIAIARGGISLDVADGGTHTTGSTRFDTFEITADGPKDDIAGTGRVHLADLQVDHEFPILTDKCNDSLKLNASLGIGAVDIGLRLEHGDLHGSSRVASPRVRLSDTGQDECEWNDSFDVDVVKTVTATVCWVPIIKEICKEVEKHVKVPVRVPVRFQAVISSIDIPGSADHIDIQLRGSEGVGFCVKNARLNAEGRIQQVSVTPTFEARGDLGNLVKDVHDTTWRATLGSLQSSLVTSITNIGSIATHISPVSDCG